MGCWQWATLLFGPESNFQCFYLLYVWVFYHLPLIPPERAVKRDVVVVFVSYQHAWPWDMVWNWILLIAQQPISVVSVWRHVRFIENKQGPVLVWSHRHHSFWNKGKCLIKLPALMHPRFWRHTPQVYGFVSFLDTHNKTVILKVHSCVPDTTADTGGLYSFRTWGTVGVCNRLYLLVFSQWITD